MVRIATPDYSAPELDIKLNQNPNAFFFPASTISGHVIYKNHYGNADYDLRLIFCGFNRTARKGTSKAMTGKATLFEYTFNLHTARKGRNHKLANSQVDTAPMSYAFKHRFPSATDNRSFSLASGTTVNSSFQDHAHDLPPSFGAQCRDFECSVDYCLRAELYYDNCLLTDYTLPVMFLPYMRPIHGTRHNPKFFSGPDLHADEACGKIRKDSLINHYPESALNMCVELPTEITLGQPFILEVQIQLPFVLEFEDEIPEVNVMALKMVSLAHCRFIHLPTVESGHSIAVPSEKQQYQKSKSILLHPSRSTSLPVFDPATSTLCYSFQATLSSYHTPSFRSFLVSNSFRFEGPLVVVVDGRKVELPLSQTQVAVLSSVAQPTGMRRVSTMTTTSRLDGAYGRI